MKASTHGDVDALPLATRLAYAAVGGCPYARRELAKPPPPAGEQMFRFGRMFAGLPGLADTNALAGQLATLGLSMTESAAQARGERNTRIAAIYTYLGQFIDHDITKTETADKILASNMEAAFHAASAHRHVAPLDAAEHTKLVDRRSPMLNLDSVLDGTPREADGSLRVGTVTAGPPRPTLPFNEDPDLVELHDLPRLPPSQNEETDRRARIGDPRNDENLVVAQLHVAFLRSHRLLVRKLGLAPEDADLELKRLYQRIVLDDFLPTVCDPAIVKQVLAQPQGLFYQPDPADPYMPLEFAGAAFRFGHSMVRNAYDYNSEFSGRDGKPIGTLEQLFTFTAFSGQNRGVATLPQNWIIDWSRWVDHADGTPADNVTKQMDTLLADQLSKLPQHQGVIGGADVNNLALRNLVRGLLLGLPTGQAVAQAVQAKLGPIFDPLTPQKLRDIAHDGSPAQGAALIAGGFDWQTPLWYYVLAEASLVPADKGHLGPVGSAIVADVLHQLVRLAPGNVLASPAWIPAIPLKDPTQVHIEDLLRFAQLLPAA
ncbi:Animal haem peroxidase [Roseateles sp. YR242]|uniref:peroxidase family protein n=1 Tax=Roseateles sp. YR242 TaxID=1855305 RepID=UPI0008BD6E8A|nr:peroxidase family protein [Roseateles sp. YR242]SEL09702.1 Animal haem peroxidase [Roseateles sp. YR242]